MSDNYTISNHQTGYITVKNLLGETVAMIDYEEHLSFSSHCTMIVRQEVKDFLNKKNIPFF
jgi:hypothetical protein